MKALVLEEYNKLVYQDMPEPSIEANEVLIEVKACGICGSDVHGMDGSSGRRIPPIIMGHEASGVIVKTGSEVKNFAEGDRVTFDSTIYCGECFFCRQGQINLCDNRRVLGVSPGEYRQHGAFAEYVAVPERILYRLPENLSFQQAAMVEPVSIAVHAVELTPISLNDTAVVVGAGMIGVFVIQALQAAGCGTVIAVDLDQNKLDLATKLGADQVLKADEVDVTKEVAALTQNRGAHIALEVVGNTAALNTAVSSLRKGGFLTAVGNLAPTVDFPIQAIVTRQISVVGSCASCGEYPACLDMIADGTIKVDALISKVAPLSEGAEWFDRLYRQEPGLMKVLLEP
ncbi:alcohol dehydrogenase catalytic domain-containing protein [candidate division KSB3 bacterium]|uniref:Alcohol dehydrogenase catalytic domain-containing protein n=1 Tax=candidate division KSB3 bacterium TaxID=2044937 RepID=A0A9D5JW34_9BACT|nr:alcohol dehydrogenase catalytic domain-containing protein [candidate division KSB3 bacterium]MBD3324997.1 alcohol dehydrogenase catalytic domain-containing protein [candidate division KSB3 bacterium]